MKIIAVIVDEMPKGASGCKFAESFYFENHIIEITCRLTGESCQLTMRELATQRCPDCPLRPVLEKKEPCNE